MYQNLDAITFDFHNTLARCDEWFELEVRDLVPAFLRWHSAKTCAPYSPDLCERAVSVYRTLRLGIAEHGIEMDAEACVDTVTRELGLELPRQVIEEGVHSVMRETLGNSTPIDGAVDAVRSLHGYGLKLGVISSAVYHPFLEWSLDKFGILGCFQSVVSSARCGYYKSRVEIYEESVSDLGARPHRTVHIGDSYKYDVETPVRLGMITIWYDAEGTAGNGHQAHAVVSSLVGIENLIRRIGSETH